jgi:hypothetical protein
MKQQTATSRTKIKAEEHDAFQRLRMNKYIFVLCLLASQAAFSQDIEQCRAVVRTTFDAINGHTAWKLKPFLAKDFIITGSKVGNDRILLDTLFRKLADSVASSKEINEDRRQNTLKLTYAVRTKKLGAREFFFVFNTDNQLKELFLFEMIQTSTTVARGFKLHRVGNLPASYVSLNGMMRSFLFDNGSPGVVLNSNYFKMTDTDGKIILTRDPAKSLYEINMKKGKEETDAGFLKRVKDEMEGSDKLVNELKWNDFALTKGSVSTMDLSGFQRHENEKIYGVIGYETVKEYDLIFDFSQNELTLINPDMYEKFIKKDMAGKHFTVVPCEFQKHVPVVKIQVGGKEYAMGIVCGVDKNILHQSLVEEMLKTGSLKGVKSSALNGVDFNAWEATAAMADAVSIGQKEFKGMQFVSGDVSPYNQKYGIRLDGIFGCDMLSAQKTIISFKRKEVIFVE